MFYIYNRQHDIADYGADRRLRFDAVLKIFQEAAVIHSASVGYPADTYMGKGNIWMLNRIMLNASYFPDFSQKLEIKTWSRGLEKFKGFRNYEIKADGETCIVGSSIWLYIDIEKKRPIRVTEEMAVKYDSENLCNMCNVIDSWNTKDAENYTSEATAFLRPADFDINGHMNNIRYGELISMAAKDIDFTKKTVGLYYNHEITPDVVSVTIKHAVSDKSEIFSVFNGETLACLCEII